MQANTNSGKIDEKKLNDFMLKAIGDIASTDKFSANEESIGNGYDLITFFDCLHDMANPVGAMKIARHSLKPDGTCMVIEPMANDMLEENFNVVGRTFYATSTLVCVPNSLADNGPALGAQAGEKKIKEILEKAGFTKFRVQPRPSLI